MSPGSPRRRSRGRARAWALALPLALGLPWAAQAAEPVRPASPQDPLEGLNRSVDAFNDTLDRAALKPLAEGYRQVVPELVRTGVDNFFGNLGDAWSAVNQLLQGKLVSTGQMTLRVATNTVFGLGGVLDPATEFGLERQSEDFGQTLGRWGMPPGPYLVLPLFGPSTLRDTVALPVDMTAAPLNQVNDDRAVTGLNVLRLVNTRAGLLGAGKLLDDVALDRYSFLRDAYLARRRNQVFDGNPPEEPEEAEPPESPEAQPAPAAAPAASPATPAAPAPAASAPAAPRP